jgi:hypothetical protein
LALNEYFGKHVAIVFRELDNYYAYISHFYSGEGEFPATGGLFLNRGYGHLVLPSENLADARRPLVHELAHNCLCHLPLPLWLNEAITAFIELDVCGGNRFALDRDLEKRHRAHWNSKTIQDFWSGVSWETVGESFELGYSLAEIVLRIIHQDLRPTPSDFRAFVGEASWQDAGEAAARKYLGAGLADIAGVFLGPGAWAPAPEGWSLGEKSVGTPRSLKSVCARD